MLALYRAASPADQLVLLPLLGSLGGEEVRPIVQAAVGSKVPATYEAGVRATSNWPDATVVDQLLPSRRRPVSRPSTVGLAGLRAGRLLARRRRQWREAGQA